MKPYYADETVTLYLGDCREVLPERGQRFDCAVADPPYGETSLVWDRWPDGWPSLVAEVTLSMWCFGSMRMFLDRRDEFTEWKFGQDVVWEKHTGSGWDADRFRRVHEHAIHWYRGPWGEIHHEPPTVCVAEVQKTRAVSSKPSSKHRGSIRDTGKAYQYDGSRIQRSVIAARNMHRRGEHSTEKPVGILDPLISYACPPGGLVLDPFAGSGSTAVAARMSGRRSLLIEADERYCEDIARRLAQDVLPIGAA